MEAGAFRKLADLLVENRAVRPVLVTGGRSVRGREQWGIVTDSLLEHGYEFLEFTVRGEPGPDVVNAAVGEILQDAPESDLVVAVGGGSAIDAGKAIAAGVAIAGNPGDFDVTRYLEGVGDCVPDGRSLPLIAFPTTAGTGTEATKNAVISRTGPGGFKKSLRHTRFVPRTAVIDAELLAGCPLEVTIASGLDAVTQLIEAYLSTNANPVTDALALLGLQYAGEAYPRLATGADTPALRTNMALAAYLSGVCLTSAGLGPVHGFASPLGAARDIPHGVVCGLLLAPVIGATLEALKTNDTLRDEIRARYRTAAEALGLEPSETALLQAANEWAKPLKRLGDYGFTTDDLPGLVSSAGLKNHPIKLDSAALTDVLESVV